MLCPADHRQACSKPTQHPQKPWPRCHIHLKATLLRIYCHSALVKITPAVLWVGHAVDNKLLQYFRSLSATETREALFVPAHTRARRWGPGGTAPFPASTQAGGDSFLRHPALRTSPLAPGAKRGCGGPGCRAPIPGCRAPIPAVCRGHSGPASGAELPGLPGPSCHLPGKPSGHRPGRGLRLPRHREALERERYERFIARHTTKTPNLTHRQRLGIWQDRGKRPVSL